MGKNHTEIIPFSEVYEKNVLSCLFKNEHLTGEDELTEGHFHLPNNRDVYRIIQQEKRPIDITKLGEDLRKSDKLDALGGMASIVEIYMFCSITGNFQHEVKELHGFKARRHAIKSAYELIEKSLNLGDNEYIDAAGQPMTLVSDLASAASNTREKKHILTELLEDIESRIKGSSSSMGWPTGIQRIDEKIKGLHECRLVVISGFPTSGKTVLAIQVCWNLASVNVPALIISLEMPDKNIAERNLIMASSMPAHAITDPIEYAKTKGNNKPSKEHLQKLQRALKSMNNQPIYFEDPTGATMNQIVAIIRRNVKRHGVKVVAVDYLQLIKASKQHFSKEQEVAEISHTFQALAKELKIAIILLSQQNKDGGTKYAEATAEDADAILTIIQNKDTDSDDFGKHLGIGLRKDRHYGNTGDFLPVILNKQMLRFEEIPLDQQETIKFGS